MIPYHRIPPVRFNSDRLDQPGNFGRLGLVLLLADPRSPSPEEIRFDALLYERQTALRDARRGLWSKIWRFLWGHKG
jgi:hypothetical protein